jgi:hypothetical protein
MKLHRIWKSWILCGCLLCSAPLAHAQNEETEPAPASQLATVILPGGAQRVREKSVPKDVETLLASLIKVAGPQVRQGRNEVLAWHGKGYSKARAAGLMKDLATAVTKAGWQYKSDDSNPAFSVVSLLRDKPQRQALIGVWVPSDEALVLAWTEMLPANNVQEPAQTPADDAPVDAKPVDSAPTQTTPATSNTAQVATPAGATVLEVNATTQWLNVMKNAAPKLPTFSQLTPKPGYVRGFVKDLKGKPLSGAHIGVRATAVGGAYSGAQGKTDAKGYYEIQVPFGAAHFYNAGYAVDYGDGRAALGLHPADGELDSFASNVGGVENFVLMPYGIADRDGVQENPRYSGNYYGGCVVFSWSIADERPIFASPSDIPANSVLELTLTPQTPLLDGSKGRTFVIRKSTEDGFGQLYVVNIPLATYKLGAKIVGGGALKMKEVGPNGGTLFGIDPKEGEGTVSLQLRPSTAKADRVTAAHGNWEHISVSLKR